MFQACLDLRALGVFFSVAQAGCLPSGGEQLQAYFIFLLILQPQQKDCYFLSGSSKIPGVKVIGLAWQNL